MVAIKKSEADAFAARPDPARLIVLLYGPDAGLVRERAERIIRSSVEDLNDPFALVRLEGDELASTPSRLAEEVHTVPLFGGKRAIWIKAGSRNFAPAVDMVLDSPPADCRVVIEAGDLRKSSPLRTACEKAKAAAAIACYADDERDLVRLIDDEMRNAKLTIAPDARAALIALIGGDRQASRSEIRKLTLYAQGQEQVGLADVLAVVADASALALDAVVDAAFAGRPGEAEAQFTKALDAGTAAGTILGAALRHVGQLHKARVAIDAGERPDAALYGFMPPIHFGRKPQVESALRAWTSSQLSRAMQQLADALLNARRTPALADALGQRALLQVAMTARRKER
ncbi:MAG: DNA polymerase III subunit delta [Tardiphaga sp.]